jgi:CsbD-like
MENNIEINPVNQDILEGKWKQMRGELKTWWGKLTDDDFDRISGQKDKLIGWPYVGQGTRVRRDCREEGERGGARYR